MLQQTTMLTKSTSSTHACRLPSKRTTFIDKLKSFNKPSRNINLSLTSAPASISNVQAFSPFWTERFKGVYDQLWLPTKTDFADSLSTSLTPSLRNAESTCRYLNELHTSKSLSLSSQTTSLRSLRFSQPDTTAPESTESEGQGQDQDQDKDASRRYCRKIRFYPSQQQKELFNKCLGASRFFFNKANAAIKEGLRQKKASAVLQRATLRPLVMASDADVSPAMAWQKEVPYDTRQEAIAECIAAYKGCLTKVKSGQITHFDVAYKSKKRCSSQTFRVNKLALNVQQRKIFVSRLGKAGNKSRLRMRRRDLDKFFQDDTLDGNFTIQKTKSNKWYVCLPRTRPLDDPRFPVFENAAYKAVFLDTGTRTFQTLYTPEGACGKLGHGFQASEIMPLAKRHDALWSVLNRRQVQNNGEDNGEDNGARMMTSKTKRHLRLRCAKLRDKMKNKVNDLHWQTCRFLCDAFRYIVIPEYPVSQMVKGSKLGSKITRQILSLSPGKFKERLLWYAKMRGRTVCVVKEDYTTKTCGCCGVLKDNVGSAKTFVCERCGAVIDRDYNGARNIALKLATHCLLEAQQ